MGARFPWKAYGRYGSIGIEWVLSVVIGLWIGHRADAYMQSSPWFTLLGFVVGVYAGARALFQAVKKMNRDLESEEKSERPSRPPSERSDD